MEVSFKESFERDLRSIGNKKIFARVRAAVGKVEGAEHILQVPGVKKIHGTQGYFRLKLGEYRLGIAVEGRKAAFVRILHRKDIYRYFP